jgi:hypothetical protein
VALSGHIETDRYLSAFGGEADMRCGLALMACAAFDPEPTFEQV